MAMTTLSTTDAPWERAELEAWLRLSLTPGVGNAAARRLLARFGAPQSIFQETVGALQECVNLAQAAQLRHIPDGFFQVADTTWHWLQNPPPGCHHAVIALGHTFYPEGLLHIPDPPLLLYVVGPNGWMADGRPFDWARSLAIVGSRNPTAQGGINAKQFALNLAQGGWCIVSGMALGVDAAAHQGALEAQRAGILTIAVIGTGVDRVYPRQHKALAHQIAQKGLVISEFPLGTPPIAANFPKRNRIISGLSRGTLVVEAALASGSLITARTASEQGREVFAIPGSIHAPQSRGCHALIRQGAKLVESAQDILEEFPLTHDDKVYAHAESAQQLSIHGAQVQSHPVLEAMGYDPIGLDALSARTGYGAADLQVQLLELELEGLLARLPGSLFQRVVQA